MSAPKLGWGGGGRGGSVVPHSSVFHPGEVAVQTKAGTRRTAQDLEGMVTPHITPDKAWFISQRREAFITSVTPDGAVWASAVFGPPAFAAAHSRHDLIFDLATHPLHPGDPLAQLSSEQGTPAGILFIDLETRRRVRINGEILVSSERDATLQLGAGGVRKGLRNAGILPNSGLLRVGIREAFGNCPKYIQSRVVVEEEAEEAVAAAAREGDEGNTEVSRGGKGVEAPAAGTLGSALALHQQRWIAQTDTFFFGTVEEHKGADMSHRGGVPGFVRVVDERTLLWPDYAGNGMFQSLGNVLVNPRSAVLVVGWDSRSLLQLSGRSTVLFPADIKREGLAAYLDGADRAVRFTVDAVRETPGVVPFNYRFAGQSPYNPRLTKVYPLPLEDLSDTASLPSDPRALSGEQAATSGQRSTVRCVSAEDVATGIRTFVFELSDTELERELTGREASGEGGGAGAGVVPGATAYRPGQYAVFELVLPRRDGTEGTEMVTRTWTISGAEMAATPVEEERLGRTGPSGVVGPSGAGGATGGTGGLSGESVNVAGKCSGGTRAIGSAKRISRFSITVKKQPGGQASTWLHEKLQAGHEVEVKSIGGEFTCFGQQGEAPQPGSRLLFLSAGVGITPLLAMVRGLRSSPLSAAHNSSPVDVVFITTALDAGHVPYRNELREDFSPLPGLRLRFVDNFTRLSNQDAARDTITGRLTLDQLLGHVPDVKDRDVFLCGPVGYMSAVGDMLAAGGVAPSRVHVEKFDF